MLSDTRFRAGPIPFVLATVAIDALAFGLVIPVMPPLVMELSHLGAASASVWLGMLLAVFSAMQFLCSPLLGALSDRFGRRPVLLLSLAGICVNNLSLAVAPSLMWLLVGRLVAGATAANYAAATAAIADVSTPDQRAKRFGRVGAMFGLGFVLGPAMGGLLSGYGLRVPFLVAAGLAGLNLVYGAVAVPETLTAAHRRPFAWREANPLRNMRVVAGDAGYGRLVLAWCCTWFALGALQSVFVLANDMRLGWGARENGLALAAVGVGAAAVQGFLVNRAVRRLGERRAVLVGYVLSGAAYVAFGLANQTWILMLGIGLQSVAAISGPALQALVSSRVGPERQGEVQGALASFQGLTAIVAPLLAGWVFEVFASPGVSVFLPGAPFYLAAAAYVVAFWAVLGVRPAQARAAAAVAE